MQVHVFSIMKASEKGYMQFTKVTARLYFKSAIIQQNFLQIVIQVGD